MAVAATTALAQSTEGSFELTEVIVTATKVETNLQKASLSVTAISGDDMVKEGKKNLQEILADVPNVSMQGGGSQGSFFVIRGVGNNPVFGQDASVTFTTNGVFNQRGNSLRGSFFDVDRVEVTRGPQNLYTGRSSEGGSINVIPNEPKLGKTEGSASLEAGSYGLLAGQGALNLPVNDMIAVRGAFTTVKRAGFNSDGSYDEATTAGRLRVLFQPTETFKAVLTGAYTAIGGKGDVQGITTLINNSSQITFPNGYYYNINPPDTNQDYRVEDVYADITWKTPLATIYFQPTWQYSKLFVNGWSANYLQYQTNLANGVPDRSAYGGTVSLQRNNSYQTQRSQEIRISNPDGSRIKWMLGAYNYRNDQPINVGVNNFALSTCNSPANITPANCAAATVVAPDLREPGIYGNSNRRLETSKDVYGQFTVPFTDTWRGTAGARYSKIGKSRNPGPGFFAEPDGIVINSLGNAVPLDNGIAGNTGVGQTTTPTGVRGIPLNDFVFDTAPANLTFSRVNWKAVIEHDLAADKMVYAGVSTGWKSGSFINLPSPSDVCPNNRPSITSTVNLGNCLTSAPAGATYLAPGYTNSYKPEYLTSFEIGTKNQFLDNRLRLNVAAFYYDYKGYQFNVNLPVWNPATGVDPDAVIGTTLNADKAESYGGEIESSFLITQQDKVDLGVSLLHAVFKQVTIPPAPSAAAASTLAYVSATQWAAGLSSGFSLPQSPKWVITPAYSHIFRLGSGATIVAGVDGKAQGGYVINLPGVVIPSAGNGFTSGAGLLQRPWLYTQGSYFKYNLSLSLNGADGSWGITAYGHNVGNKINLTQITVPTAVTGTGTAGLQNIGFQADEPREFGVILNWKM